MQYNAKTSLNAAYSPCVSIVVMLSVVTPGTENIQNFARSLGIARADRIVSMIALSIRGGELRGSAE